ncbi:unnamed protein product [Phytomonas sp. EM1]|nr:unnamed protein product [Phytomonas sp. EM1]|eukprot:CCW62184.1 unnamed protein product [Phytomonas sp. isolate EM1]
MLELGDIEFQTSDEDSKTHEVRPSNRSQGSRQSKNDTPSLSVAKDAGGKFPSRKNLALGRLTNLQKQRDREFAQRKALILADLGGNAGDLSPKGSVDAKCLPIMAILNNHPDYITTSSCSGRIALFHSQTNTGEDHPVNSTREGFREDGEGDFSAGGGRKRGGDDALGWIFVKHGALLPAEQLAVVRFLCGPPLNAGDRAMDEAELRGEIAPSEAYGGELEGLLEGEIPQNIPTFGMVCLKMEPFVMHVECRGMESAKRLLSAAVSDAGYRNSGVIPPGRRVMCAIRSTNGCAMEVPVVSAGVNHVRTQRAYVWALLKLANEKMLHNESRVKLLWESIKRRLDGNDDRDD